jgi:hypothetical protein
MLVHASWYVLGMLREARREHRYDLGPRLRVQNSLSEARLGNTYDYGEGGSKQGHTINYPSPRCRFSMLGDSRGASIQISRLDCTPLTCSTTFQTASFEIATPIVKLPLKFFTLPRSNFK